VARIYTPSSQKLEQVLFSDNDQEWARDMRQRLQARAQATGARWQETLVDSALHQLVEYASGALTSYC
jgi:hypothetical protein